MSRPEAFDLAIEWGYIPNIEMAKMQSLYKDLYQLEEGFTKQNRETSKRNIVVA